ncbi:unnamed protein product [Linum tenue]|uniref:Uncharacterized protein n=1 Tax=Linum tenue TaxID=586396 RepID=A0AAV0RVY8_9ROSI|nr:unnamed protein product [Linum tenue]
MLSLPLANRASSIWFNPKQVAAAAILLGGSPISDVGEFAAWMAVAKLWW